LIELRRMRLCGTGDGGAVLGEKIGPGASIDPSREGARLRCDRDDKPVEPPTNSAPFQRVERSQTHSWTVGVLIVSPAGKKTALVSLLWRSAGKGFCGSGQGGVLGISKPFDGRGATIASMPWPPSPPKTSATTKVATSEIVQREDATPKIAEGFASQSSKPLAVRRSRRRLHPHSRVVPFPRKDDVASGINLGKIGELAVGNLHHQDIGELELRTSATHPPPEKFSRRSMSTPARRATTTLRILDARIMSEKPGRTIPTRPIGGMPRSARERSRLAPSANPAASG